MHFEFLNVGVNGKKVSKVQGNAVDKGEEAVGGEGIAKLSAGYDNPFSNSFLCAFANLLCKNIFARTYLKGREREMMHQCTYIRTSICLSSSFKTGII